MKKSRLEPFKEKIKEMLSEGATYIEIVDYLYYNENIDTCEGAICNFVRKNHLRDVVADERPVCTKCENYIEIGTKYIQDRHTNVRVCKACLEVIPQTTSVSPRFCPKRKESQHD